MHVGGVKCMLVVYVMIRLLLRKKAQPVYPIGKLQAYMQQRVQFQHTIKKFSPIITK